MEICLNASKYDYNITHNEMSAIWHKQRLNTCIEDVEGLSTSNTPVRNDRSASPASGISRPTQALPGDQSKSTPAVGRKSKSPSTADRTDMEVRQKRNQNLNNPKVLAAGQREPDTNKASDAILQLERQRLSVEEERLEIEKEQLSVEKNIVEVLKLIAEQFNLTVSDIAVGI